MISTILIGMTILFVVANLYYFFTNKTHKKSGELTQRNETRKNTYAATVRNSTGLWSFNLVNGRM